MRALLLLLILAVCARAEELRPRAVSEGLPVMTRVNAFDLGNEAARAKAWLDAHPGARLEADALVAGAETLPLSPRLALSLRRLNRFVGAEDDSRANPISFEDLETEFLSARGVAVVRGLFDRAMAARLVVGGKAVIPEIGGEMEVENGLVFHVLEDALRPALREMLSRRKDPEALRRLFRERPEEMAALDRFSTLKNHLETRKRWDAENKVPQDRRDALLDMAVDTVAQTAVDTYTMGARQELEDTLGRDWTGRYVSHWHLHPPDAGKTGWEESQPPSPEDQARSQENGREIVVVFHPDGFDVYDLGREGRDRSFSHRSPDWRDHFQKIFDSL